MIQLLVRVPENEYWQQTDDGWESSLPDQVIGVIMAYGGQFTDDPLFGTRTYEGHKLVSYVGNSTWEEIQDFFTKYIPTWNVLAANDTEGNQYVQYDPAVLVNYIPDIVVYDEDGSESSRTRPTKIEHIGRFSGMPDFEPVEEI